MANCDSTQQPGASASGNSFTSAERDGAEAPNPAPKFRPFQWHQDALDDPEVQLPARALMEFVGRAKDVANGIGTILEIAEAEQNERFYAPSAPMFSPCDLAALMRLGITSASLLAAEAEDMLESAYERHTLVYCFVIEGTNYEAASASIV